MVRRPLLWILLLICLMTGAPAAWGAKVTATADRDSVGAGESLQLELRIDGSPDADPDLSVLDADWEVLGRAQSSQMNIVNGRMDRATVYSLTLMPRRSGRLTIPSICCGADCSAAQIVDVGQGPAAGPDQAERLALEVTAAPHEVPVGAQVLLSVRLVHRISLAGARLSEPKPEGVDAEVQQLGKDRRFETRRNGYRYAVIERRYVVFPQKAGRLTIPALQLDAQESTGRLGFDPFGRGLQQLRRRSEPVTIEVRPVPADAGRRNWLPARRLTLEDDWQSHLPALRVGEPATRTLTVTAIGLPAAHLSELAPGFPDNWKSYPDQPLRQDAEDDDGIVGTLQQKIALVPTRPGKYELPAIDLDWYDVAAKAWQRAHLDPLQVTVAPAASGSTAATPAPPPAAPPAVPPAPEVPAPAPPAAAPQKESPGPWPWISLALATGWLLTVLGFWRQMRRPRPAPDKRPSGAPDQAQTRQALGAVITAAGTNDAAATRQALLYWSRCRWPQARTHDLERLARRCGEPLATAIDQLNAALYGPAPSAWQGAPLAEAVKRLPEPAPQKPQALPPLYP